MDKWVVVYSSSGTIQRFFLKSANYEYMQQPEWIIQKHYVEWKKLNTKQFLLYDSTCMTF